MGSVDFAYNATWIQKSVLQNFIGDSYHTQDGVYFDGAPVFRWQHNGQVVWNLDPIIVGLDAHYKSGYVEQVGTFGGRSHRRNNPSQASRTTTTIFGTYAMPKGFSATFGVRNLFDRYPPYSNQTDVFKANYDPRFADPTGRTFYFRGGYSF